MGSHEVSSRYHVQWFQNSRVRILQGGRAGKAHHLLVTGHLTWSRAGELMYSHVLGLLQHFQVRGLVK